MKKMRYIPALAVLCFLLLMSLVNKIVFAENSKTVNNINKNIIYVYADDGVGEVSLLQTILTLKEALSDNYRVHKISAEEIIRNNWVKNAALLVIPGGADLPYARKLNGKGNRNIKNYVKNGGSYLGICAGSYYGSSYIEFNKGGKLEVLGKRELAFFPGSAIGPILAKYDYRSNSGARAAKIRFKLEQIKEASVYYNGGGYFKNAANYKDVAVLGYYRNRLPAIIHISFGKGNAVLSGVHFEYNPHLLNTHDPYLNNISLDLKHYDAIRKKLVEAIIKKLNLLCENVS